MLSDADEDKCLAMLEAGKADYQIAVSVKPNISPRTVRNAADRARKRRELEPCRRCGKMPRVGQSGMTGSVVECSDCCVAEIGITEQAAILGWNEAQRRESNGKEAKE